MGLRILIVSDHYPPFIGGAHRQTQLLARMLAQRGHLVRVATVWQPDLPAEEDDSGVKVHRLKQLRSILPWPQHDGSQRYQPPFPDPITSWQLRRLIDEFRPDLVHSYGWFSYSCAAALLGKDIPLLITARDYAYSCATRTLVHDDTHICSGPAPLKCLACSAHHYGAPKGWLAALGVFSGRRLLKHKLDGIHSISAFVQEIVERDFLGPSDARAKSGQAIVHAIIPSFGEDPDAREASDPKLESYLRLLPASSFILFVGALRVVKGLEQLLAAYERLNSPPPLVLVGTVERDTPRVFPSGVVVLEEFPHEAVMRAWDRCLFGVVPSLWPEPLGSVVYEGMSRGKAVIGTSPGGHTDMIVDGKTGLLVKAGDTESLADAMQRLIEDANLRERLGRAAKERAGLFKARVNVPRFEELYRRLTEKVSHVYESNSSRLGQY